MTTPIPGSPEGVRQAGTSLGAASARLGGTAADVTHAAGAVGASWTGAAAGAATAATARYGPALDVGARGCHRAAAVLATYADELRDAQRAFDRASDRYEAGRAAQGPLGAVPVVGDLLPGHEDVEAGLAGMAAARTRAETANRLAASAIDAVVADLAGMEAPMPSPGGPGGGFGPSPFGPGSGPPAPPTGASCAETLSCTIADFEAMSIAERQAFADEFTRRWGGPLGASDRYANVGGVLHFFRDDQLGQQGSWVSWVDASILHGIERGAATQMGMPGGTQGNPGADRWAAYFRYVHDTGDADSDKADRLWSQGEQASTRNGYQVADQEGAPSPGLPELSFAGGGEIYRYVLRHEGTAKDVADAAGNAAGSTAGGPAAGRLLGALGREGVNDFFDPSNPAPSYLGGHVMHGGGQYVQGTGQVLQGLGTHDPGTAWQGLQNQVHGGAESVRYGAEGVADGVKWLVHNPFD